MDCNHDTRFVKTIQGCIMCEIELGIKMDRERIIEALKKLPGSNGRRAEQIIRAIKVEA